MDLVLFEEIAIEVAKSGSVTSDHISTLRRSIYPDMAVSRLEAEGMYAIERARRVPNRAWTDVFIEVVSDHVLKEPPIGYVSDDVARWLQDQIQRRKRPSMDGDVALVAHIVEQAREVPAPFSAFALLLVKDAVVFGEGQNGRGSIHVQGRVDDADVAILQQILWGAGAEGPLAISRDEAEALFAIADATTGADNAVAFEDLFARAVGNYLIGATGRDVPSRQEALAWTTRGDYKMNVVGALSKMMQPTIDDIIEGLGMRSLTQETSRATEAHHGEANLTREIARLKADAVVPEKALWLLDRVNHNGVMSPAETALLRFIAREGAATDPALKSLLAKVA